MTTKRLDNCLVSKLALESLPAMIDERRLKCWLLAVFRGSSTECPKCKKPLTGKVLKTFLQGGRTRCRLCQTKIQLWQDTPLQAMKIDQVQFYLFACLSQHNFKGFCLSDLLNVGNSTAHMWRRRFAQMSIDRSEKTIPVIEGTP